MELRAVEGLPEVSAGDDIAAMVAERDPPPDGSVVVVASTIVSKAEGRGRRLEAYEPGARAERIAARLGERTGERKDPRFAQAVLDESEELLIEDPFLLAVTHFGHVGVNAGIDRTNLPDGSDILLLPRDPSASAARIREGLPGAPPVVVADTSGRPFRVGQRGVAIGWAGMPPTRDWRGRTDRRGRELRATVEAVVDELASAANLLMGEADGGRPVVTVSGLDLAGMAGGDRLFRRREDDLVRSALRGWRFDR
ncbi:MAG: coenzyme F420-0:L-glutamate ligase [Halobacteriota archaeon]